MALSHKGQFIINREKIEREQISKKFLPSESVEGIHCGCNYSLNPESGSLIIKGNSREHIEECASQIIRTLHREYGWTVSHSENLHSIRGEGEGVNSRGVSVDVNHVLSKSEFERRLKDEYSLPNFLNLLFKEAIINNSSGKPRIAFFLAYNALERACKLLYVCHYGGKKKDRVRIDKILEELQKDPDILLTVNLLDFESKEKREKRGDTSLNYRIIRNAIGHGDPTVSDEEISPFVIPLFNNVDLIFQQVSYLLVKYKDKLS